MYAPCRNILKATVILLPLLGVTWLFGLLTLNSNTTVFAWLFTIFNSLQVRSCFPLPATPYLYIHCLWCEADTQCNEFCLALEFQKIPKPNNDDLMTSAPKLQKELVTHMYSAPTDVAIFVLDSMLLTS